MQPIKMEPPVPFVAIVPPMLVERLKQEQREQGFPETLPDWVIVVDKLEPTGPWTPPSAWELWPVKPNRNPTRTQPKPSRFPLVGPLPRLKLPLFKLDPLTAMLLLSRQERRRLFSP